MQVEVVGCYFASTYCSCPVGQSLCHHTIVTLYQVSHYMTLKLKRVPSAASKTSVRQVTYDHATATLNRNIIICVARSTMHSYLITF